MKNIFIVLLETELFTSVYAAFDDKKRAVTYKDDLKERNTYKNCECEYKVHEIPYYGGKE